MDILKGEDEIIAKQFLSDVIKVAKQARCKRSKCGAIIVKDNSIIGRGFNSPPKNLETQRRCFIKKDEYNIKVTDKTCCIHAEQRAIMDALKNTLENLDNSRLYFIRLDLNDNIQHVEGMPYCTICSKMALDSGIEEFVLLYKDGFHVFKTQEYNNLSFEYSSH